MTMTLEERVATLENELSNLKKAVDAVSTDKDWRKSFGKSANDPGFDEMIGLGAAIRAEDHEDDA